MAVVTQYFTDITVKLNTWIHNDSDYIHKTCTRLIQTKSEHQWRAHEVPPHTHQCEKLFVVDFYQKMKSHFSSGIQALKVYPCFYRWSNYEQNQSSRLTQWVLIIEKEVSQIGKKK